MRLSFLIPLLALPASCAPMQGEPGAPPLHGAGRCDAASAQSLVGQPATVEAATQARDRSGATIVRWLRPGMMVTMEYRADRLNIEIDGEGRIASIRCG